MEVVDVLVTELELDKLLHFRNTLMLCGLGKVNGLFLGVEFDELFFKVVPELEFTSVLLLEVEELV